MKDAPDWAAYNQAKYKPEVSYPKKRLLSYTAPPRPATPSAVQVEVCTSDTIRERVIKFLEG